MKHLSVSYDNGEILTAVSEIFLRGSWYDADVTFGKGAFWKGLQRPGRCSDLHPLFPDVVQDDSTELRTYADSSMGSIVFDPPFLFRSRRAENTETMCRWYGYFRSYAELWDMYSQSLDAIRRVLRPRGRIRKTRGWICVRQSTPLSRPAAAPLSTPACTSSCRKARQGCSSANPGSMSSTACRARA